MPAVLLAALALMLAAASVAWALGELTQINGTAGCIDQDGSEDDDGIDDGCTKGIGLDGATSVAISPDGNSVYAVSHRAGALLTFDRDPETGGLTQKSGKAGCISSVRSSSQECEPGRASGDNDVLVSPDGRQVYAVGEIGPGAGAVASFNRDPSTGALTQLAGKAGCISEDGTEGNCEVGKALDGAFGGAISPDGTSVYLASGVADAVAVFRRDSATGALSQLAGKAGCVSDTGSGGACDDGVALDNTLAVAISPDGRNVYVASGIPGSVTAFDRDPATGALTQKPGKTGCTSFTGSGGACEVGRGLLDAEDVIVSNDGKSVYVASPGRGAVVIFDRDPTTGVLTQKPGKAGCLAKEETEGCELGKGLNGNNGLAESPDGEAVYDAGWSPDALVILERDPATGALTQPEGKAGCISETGSGGICETGRALVQVHAPVVSPEGNDVYVASHGSDAIAIFNRFVGSQRRKPPAKSGGGSGGKSPSTSPPDRTAPRISGFKVTPKRFKVGAKRSPTFSFTLSEAADASVAIERVMPGRRVGKACKRALPGSKAGRRCKRLVPVGILSLAKLGAGANSVPFEAKALGRKLASGSYQATITARDAAGNQAEPQSATFTLVKPRRSS